MIKKLRKNSLLLLLLLFAVIKANAQYATSHYIAPSPWQYWSNANEIVLTTESTTTVTVTLRKSDGTFLATRTLTSAAPDVYRFVGSPWLLNSNPVNSVQNDRGLIVESTGGKVSVNLRNVASDQANGSGGDTSGATIKGNASLVSFGNEGRGTSFRLGYYRTNFSGIQGFNGAANRPVYSVMAIDDNTQVKLNGANLVLLNKGQSYLFQPAGTGDLLEANKPVVANTGAYTDAPGGCGDGAVDQMAPISILGMRYIVIRGSGTAGTGTNLPEQSTIVATEANTQVTVSNYNQNGIFINTTTYTLSAGGSYQSIHHGNAANSYSSSIIESNKPIAVYSGSAQTCEVDIATVLPVGGCSGSKWTSTSEFKGYSGQVLPYFGFVLVESSSAAVFVNGSNIETTTGNLRFQLGSTGVYLIRFDNIQISNPSNITVSSTARMNVGIVQQGGGFSMSGFFSSFNETPALPEVTKDSNGCAINIITADPGLQPYQWYLDGVLIPGATNQSIVPVKTGNYSITGTRDCGVTGKSAAVYVAVCGDREVTKSVTNGTLANEVVFSVTAKNNGPNVDQNVRVTDLLPSGYTFVSALPSIGSYNAATGVWTIGNLAVNSTAVLAITASIKTAGAVTNSATITGDNIDYTLGNNTAIATPFAELKLRKTARVGAYNQVGAVITYDLVLSNTGKVPVINVNITDANADSGSISPATVASILPGASVNITATHTVVEADLIAGKVLNSASATGVDGSNNSVLDKSGTDINNDTPTETETKSLIVANNNSATTNEDTAVTINVTTNDTNIGGTTNLATVDLDPSTTGIQATFEVAGEGSYSVDNTGLVTFTPEQNYNGIATPINYTVNNNHGIVSNIATISITVMAVNDAPVAVDDLYTVAEDATVTLNPLALDTDLDGDTLTVTSINGTALTGSAQIITVPNGTVNISATGVITFTPDANYNSATAISIPYVISDGTTTATANELITVTAVNDAPVAVDDLYTVAEDATVTLNPLALDTDLDGDTLTVTSINGITLTGGVQTIPVTNGTVNISATGVITFTPDANYNSATAISIPYVISDGTTTATANQLITVTAVNDAPVAVDDLYTVAEDATVTLNPLALDTDLDGDTLTVTSINGTALTGSAQIITVPNGTVNISATGVITFTPDANYNSATAISIPYVISDGTTTATANQLITVTAVNDAPVAVDDLYTVAEDATVTLNPLALDTDLDGDTLTMTSINGITLTGGVQTIPVTNGTVNISAAGVITFTPDANYNSATAISIPYVISDGTTTATANEFITVTAVNDAPVAVDDLYTVAEDATVTLNPLALDTDLDGDTLTVTSINGITLTGGVQTIPVTNGTVNISATGVITFTPDANYNSATAISIPYVISDGTTTATANQLITVTAVNDAPVAVDDLYTVAEDATVTLNPLALDTDLDGDTLTVTSINGTALTGSAQIITVPNGTVNISATGVITFTPDANYNSATAISIPYVISDGTTTATANQLITVTAVNDAPVAVDDLYTVAEDATVTLNPLALDTDLDGDTLTVTSINGITLTGGVQTIPVTNGTVNISAAGVITFTPDANYNSATAISIPYVISDGTTTATANQLITVTAVNDAPVAVDDLYTVAEDATVTLNPLALDTDLDGDTLTMTSINGITLTGGVQTIPVTNGTVNISAAGVITFTPDANYNSATAISIPYVISDGTTTATANEFITVTAVNDAPVAVDDLYTVAEDATVTLNPLALDTDLDGDTLTVTSINGITLTGGVQTIPVTNGTVNISATGVITFTPDANYNSATAISIPYVISDGTTTATANQLITVMAVNDAPVAVDDLYTVAEDATVTLNPLALDTDLDGDTLTVTSINGTALTGSAQIITVPNGTVNISATGVITFTPDANYNSATAISIPYVISDGTTTATANELITVTAVNDAPVAVDDLYTVAEDATVTLNPLALDTDLDGDTLTVTSINGITLTGGVQTIPVTNGTVNISATGVITFTPDANYNSATAISIPYVISDGTTTATANQLITVTAVNDAPVAVDDLYTVAEDATVTLNPLALDTDLDGDTLTVTSINGITLTGGVQTIPVTNGTVNISAAGVITFTPDANYNSATAISIPYVISDGTTTATANELITVTAVNDAPVAVDDTNAAILSTSGAIPINALMATDLDGTIVSYTILSLPLQGVLSVSGVPVTTNQVLTPTQAAMLTYDPSGTFTGNDTFTFTATDNQGGIDASPALITLVISEAILEAIADPVRLADGINGSLEVINVLDNDKINGTPVNSADVIVKGMDVPAGITLNSDGSVDVAPGTKGGNHTFTYQICETANPSNCSSATVDIFVEIPSIAIVKTVALNDDNANGYAEAGETLTYSFTIANTGNVALENIVVSDPLPGIVMNGSPINLAVGQTDSSSITGTYTLTQEDVNSGSISNQATASGITKSGITVVDKSDFSDVNGEKPTILELSGCVIKIFNAVSANGDSQNTRFYIQGLECYPDNTVQIYNRWGVLVFERDHYNNSDIAFRGISEGRVTIKDSNGLPEGTYYYIVRYKDKQSNPHQEAGYLYLTK